MALNCAASPLLPCPMGRGVCCVVHQTNVFAARGLPLPANLDPLLRFPFLSFLLCASATAGPQSHRGLLWHPVHISCVCGCRYTADHQLSSMRGCVALWLPLLRAAAALHWVSAWPGAFHACPRLWRSTQDRTGAARELPDPSHEGGLCAAASWQAPEETESSPGLLWQVPDAASASDRLF